MGWDIDATDYRKAARGCGDLAATVIARIGSLHRELTGSCAGMAGDYSTSLRWITDYESATADWLSVGTLLSEALRHYGDVLAAMAYNWDIANQTLPHPDRPPPSEPVGNPFREAPTARGDNGNGIEILGVGSRR